MEEDYLMGVEGFGSEKAETDSAAWQEGSSPCPCLLLSVSLWGSPLASAGQGNPTDVNLRLVSQGAEQSGEEESVGLQGANRISIFLGQSPTRKIEHTHLIASLSSLPSCHHPTGKEEEAHSSLVNPNTLVLGELPGLGVLGLASDNMKREIKI